MRLGLAIAVAIGLAPGGEADVGAPRAIVVATTRGDVAVPVTMERGHPVLPLPALAQPLPVEAEVSLGWATVRFAGQPFRFLLDAPVFVFRGRSVPLVGGAYVVRDTLFVPLEWLTVYVPQVFSEAYRYDPIAARFEDARLTPVIRHAATRAASPPSSGARKSGFRTAHKVVVDAGHGGVDPGNPGLYLPRGVKEKHITLALANRLRHELEDRGVSVVMTRTTDTLINLFDRAPLCREDCDLFISVHLNSLPRRRGFNQVSGFETFFLDEARTADAARVAQMENEALRYEMDTAASNGDPLSFILKDLHTNEYLRESALLAELVQSHGSAAHPGERRRVAQAPFAVLGTARRPAILVEAGFATNRADARFLASESGQRRLAKAIADGVVEYLLQYEKKTLMGAGP
jgi:N-acetylmuramoyl-L-alanine amidase